MSALWLEKYWPHTCITKKMKCRCSAWQMWAKWQHWLWSQITVTREHAFSSFKIDEWFSQGSCAVFKGILITFEDMMVLVIHRKRMKVKHCLSKLCLQLRCKNLYLWSDLVYHFGRYPYGNSSRVSRVSGFADGRFATKNSCHYLYLLLQ